MFLICADVQVLHVLRQDSMIECVMFGALQSPTLILHVRTETHLTAAGQCRPDCLRELE